MHSSNSDLRRRQHVTSLRKAGGHAGGEGRTCADKTAAATARKGALKEYGGLVVQASYGCINRGGGQRATQESFEPRVTGKAGAAPSSQGRSSFSAAASHQHWHSHGDLAAAVAASAAACSRQHVWQQVLLPLAVPAAGAGHLLHLRPRAQHKVERVLWVRGRKASSRMGMWAALCKWRGAASGSAVQ